MPPLSKKSQAELLALVIAAGWKEDQKRHDEYRWHHPRRPGLYFSLRQAAKKILSISTTNPH